LYDGAKKDIAEFQQLDDHLKKLESDVAIEGILSSNSSIKILLPVYHKDTIPQNVGKATLGYELYSRVSLWIDDQIRDTVGSQSATMESSSHANGLTLITIKATTESKKSLKGLKERLLEATQDIKSDMLGSARVSFKLYEDSQDLLFNNAAVKKTYTAQEIYAKHNINAAKLASMVRHNKSIMLKTKGDSVKRYDGEAIDEILEKLKESEKQPRGTYTIREAAELYKKVEERRTKKDVPLQNYSARISWMKSQGQIHAIPYKNTYVIEKKEWHNFLVKVKAHSSLTYPKKEYKSGISIEDLESLIKIPKAEIEKLALTDNVFHLRRNGKIDLKSAASYVWNRTYNGTAWVEK
jgi:hypothetical protein